MPSEPRWSKDIASSTVCTWFYALAVLNIILAAAGVVGALFMFKKLTSVFLFALLMQIAFNLTNSWFLFLVCNRGLKVDGFTTFSVGPLAGKKMPSLQ